VDGPCEDGCCFDGWAAGNAERVRKRGVNAPITRRVLIALEREGLRGRTVLDVGCGVGDLALGALVRGADRATGIDLGSAAIGQANALARELGVAEQARFAVGDGAVEPLERHDVVAMNRVLCCYPSVDRLLANSLGAAGDVYAYTAPIHAGATGLLNRFWVGIANAWFRLRRRRYRGFQAFVHDLDAVDRTIEGAGFRRTHRSRERVTWRLAVFRRATPDPTRGREALAAAGAPST
jgi:SAM-dependent methyltransferase